MVSMVVPQTNGVGTNREVAVVFSKPMDPASINNSSFVVAGVTGTVTYDATNRSAVDVLVTPTNVRRFGRAFDDSVGWKGCCAT
jgi:hypothetical protein